VPERWQPITKTGEFLRSLDLAWAKVKKILPRIIRATVRCHRSSARYQSHPMVRYSEVPFDAILEVAELRHSSRLDYSRLESAPDRGIER